MKLSLGRGVTLALHENNSQYVDKLYLTDENDSHRIAFLLASARRKMNVETEEMSLELRLAAIVTLLSSSALRGATANKTVALQSHLAAASQAADLLGPYLKEALEQSLAGWQKVKCHPDSVPFDACPLTVPGQFLH